MVNIAIVGAGNWGKNLVRTFSQLPGVDLVYICDASIDVRRQMQALYPGVVCVSRLEAVLGENVHPEVDAVVIATGAPSHYELALQALRAGKHVYVEKPLALKSAEATELVELAAAKGVRLMVGHLLEYHPAVNYMKRMLDEEQIGEPLYLYSQRVNLGVVRSAEDAWWSLAPHDISVACYLFNDTPVSVTASGHAYLQEGIADVVFANLHFADGKMAHIHVSWLDPHKIRKTTLVGSQKMVVFDDMSAAEKIRVYDKGVEIQSVESYVEAITLRTGDVLIPRIEDGEPLRVECRHFIDCIVNLQPPCSDGEDGLRVVKVLEAGSASLARGGDCVKV